MRNILILAVLAMAAVWFFFLRGGGGEPVDPASVVPEDGAAAVIAPEGEGEATESEIPDEEPGQGPSGAPSRLSRRHSNTFISIKTNATSHRNASQKSTKSPLSPQYTAARNRAE